MATGRVCAQLEVDGQVVAKTDESWQWAYGSIMSSEIYDGETFDSRLNEPGWTTLVGVRDSRVSWQPAHTLSFPNVPPASHQSPPVRRTEDVCAKQITVSPSGETLVDFGQNLAGWVRWNTGGPKSARPGDEVLIRHAEVLEHGELGTRPLRLCKAEDRIILGGDLTDYEPRFTYHGFRYVGITGWHGLKLEDITAVVINSDMERTGTFHSSHGMINQLYSNIVWGLRGNFVSIPTDCVARDERYVPAIRLEQKHGASPVLTRIPSRPPM